VSSYLCIVFGLCVIGMCLKFVCLCARVCNQGNCIGAVDYRTKFEAELKALNCKFLRRDVYVPSFHEVYPLSGALLYCYFGFLASGQVNCESPLY
jgi:hypothetical protein